MIKRALLKPIFIFILLLVGLCTSAPIYAQTIDHNIMFQGQLSDASGVPLRGSHSLTFRLYSAPTGGTALWQEAHTGAQQVPFVNGHFVVTLGDITAFPGAIFNHYPLHLSIAIGSNPEMSPRIALHAQPYAFKALKADDADRLGGHAHTEFVRVGEAIPELRINELSVSTANVNRLLSALSAHITNNVSASAFVGDGSRLTNLSLNNVRVGALPVSRGGTGATSAEQARLNLGIDLNDLRVNDLRATRSIQANQISAVSNGRMTPLGALAFKTSITPDDIADLDALREALGLNDFLRRSGGTMTGRIIVQNAAISLRNSAGRISLQLRPQGDIFANSVTATQRITAGDIQIQRRTGLVSLQDMAFKNSITADDLTSTTNFTRDLGLRALAFQDRVTSENIDKRSISAALNLQALAHKNIAQASDINIADVSTALGLGRLSQLDEATANHINIPSLRQALGLQALAFKSIAQPSDMNLTALVASLNLGRLATHNSITADDINLRALTASLNLRALAHKDTAAPADIDLAGLTRALQLGQLAVLDRAGTTNMDVSALSRALNLRRMAFQQTVLPEHMDLRALTASLNLRALAHKGSITADDFDDIETFKQTGLGLRGLAFKDAITGPRDFANFSNFVRNDLGLGRLATHNAITAADIANIAQFNTALGLGQLAFVDTITRNHFEGGYATFLRTLSTDLRLGTLATLDQINETHFENFEAFRAGLGLNGYLPKAGGTVTNTITVQDADIIFKESGVTRSQLLRDGRMIAAQLSTPRAVISGDISANAVTVSQQLNVSNVVARSGGHLTLSAANNRSSLQLHQNGNIDMRSGVGTQTTSQFTMDSTSIRFSGQNGRSTTPIHLEANPNYYYMGTTGARGGRLDIGNKQNTRALEPYVYLGFPGTAELILDARTARQPTASFGFVGTGDLLTLGPDTAFFGNRGSAFLEINPTQSIYLRNSRGYIGLDRSGALDMSANTLADLRRRLNFLAASGGNLTGTLNITNGGGLSIQDRSGIRTATIDSRGNAAFSRLQTDALEADSLTIEGRGRIGSIAFSDTISPGSFADFDAFKRDTLRLHTYMLKTGDTITATLNINNAGIQVNDARGTAVANITNQGSLWAKQLKVGRSPTDSTDIFTRFTGGTVIATHALRANRSLSLGSLRVGQDILTIDTSGNMIASSNIILGYDPLSETFPSLEGDMYGMDPMDMGYGYGGESERSDTVKKIELSSGLDLTTTLLASNTRGAVQFKSSSTTTGLEYDSASGSLAFRSPNGLTLRSDNYRSEININAMGISLSGPYVTIGDSGGTDILSIKDNGEVTLNATTIYITGDLNAERTTFNARYFQGSGENLTNLQLTNFSSAAPVPLTAGGTGLTTTRAIQARFGINTANFEVDQISISDKLITRHIRGVSVNGVEKLDIHAQTTFRGSSLFTGTTTFNARTVFRDRISIGSPIQYTATTSFVNDVDILSPGNRDRASLTVINDVNKAGESIAPASTARTVTGNTAILAQSFGTAPTVVAMHYHPVGYAFFAAKSTGSLRDDDFNSGRFDSFTYADDRGGAMKVINEFDGHAIVAMNESDFNTATIRATNTGSGQALTAVSNGLLPAIAAYSLGDTAIFAMGDIKTSSSKRWKRDIQPIPNALESVLRLKGVSYIRTDKQSKKRHIGFIAEEVGEIFPELVDYEDNGIDAKSVAYGKLSAVLVEALKEEHKKVQHLESLLEELSKENEALKQKYKDYENDIQTLKKMAESLTK